MRISKRGRRYHSYAGFVTTPRYFDDSPQQFLEIAPRGTGILQRVNHIPDYDYKLGERAKNFELLEESAICLGLSHCQVIGQVGSNWVHCNGTTPGDIERICDQISEKAGARFFMAGHCLVEGLREIGAKKITVVNGYYRDDWKAGINRYLEQAGFEILWSGNLIDQGLYHDLDEMLASEAKTLWDYPDEDMIAACLKAHEAAPMADAIVQTGAGFRMLQVAKAAEGLTGRPIVASDFALYWAMLKELKLTAASGHGSLLASLGGG